MQDYYLALGVSETASESIIKIAYEGKMKALAKADLSDAERRAEERLIGQAYATLSAPGKREWYDRKRADEAPRDSFLPKSAMVGGGIAVVTALLLAGGWQAHLKGVERKAARAQEERLEAERAAALARQEEAEARQSQSIAAQEAYSQSRREAEQRSRLERDRANVSASQSYANQRAQSEARQQEYAARAEQERQNRTYQQQEDRNRRQAAEDQSRAQQEVERLRRASAEREREEERIRAERDYRAQQEAAQVRQRELQEQARRPSTSR